MSNDILIERQGAVAHLVLNRPERRNALSEAMWAAIPGLIAQIETDAEIAVVILRGADDRAFAAGADISEFERVYATQESTRRYGAYVREAQAALAACAKPTIARIQGPCVGGGCGLALCCDLRMADESGRFGITPARLGLVYSLADTKRLVDTVGPARAKDILFSGRILDAEEALRIGLIDRLFSAQTLADEVDAYAHGLLEVSQYSVRASKRIVEMILNGASDDTPDTEAMFLESFQGADFKEGSKAFLEKRKPTFPFR